MRGSTAILIGNFDGVHLGHLELVDRARSRVGQGGRVAVLVFEPHPATILRPEAVPPRLTTAVRRRALLVAAGVDEVVEMAPTRERLDQSPEEFVEWLVKEFEPQLVVEGHDFRFGRDRLGTLDLLGRLGRTSGFEVVVVDPVVINSDEGEQLEVHSAGIRQVLSTGCVQDAAAQLGRPWSLEGLVVRGEQRGRELGTPTANIDHGDLVLPLDGIYAGRAVLPDGAMRLAAISVGVKPSFDAVPRLCEVHLLDHDGPLDDYGWHLEVRFEHRIRDQVAYDSIEALQEQILRDVQATRRLLRGVDIGNPT